MRRSSHPSVLCVHSMSAKKQRSYFKHDNVLLRHCQLSPQHGPGCCAYSQVAEGRSPHTAPVFTCRACMHPHPYALRLLRHSVQVRVALNVDADSVYGDDAVHRGVVPHHLCVPVFVCVPKARGSRVHTGAILLLNYARHHVLERALQQLQLLEAAVDNAVDPVVHFLRRVRRLLEGRLDRAADNLLDILLRKINVLHDIRHLPC